MKLIALTLSAALLAGAASADSGGFGSYQSASRSSEYRSAAKMVEARRYSEAIPLLRNVTAKEPDNTDAFNLLGFSLRKTGDLERSGGAYRRALSLDPRHLNALEYQGELYLMLGDVAAAEANLAQISKQCLFTCAQERALEAAIAEWRTRQGG